MYLIMRMVLRSLSMVKSKLSKIDPGSTGKFKNEEQAKEETEKLQKKMADLLYLMFAHNKYSLLIILHGIDASGKDGTVRHLFKGANPQGIRVYSFKKPSEEELKHDFLWRCHMRTPENGLAVIFNRSYYEEVTTVMVHPELLEKQNIPEELLKRKDFFERRYHRINDFEKLLAQEGTVVLKFFLNISKAEQRRRFQDRLSDHSKNWKFSAGDIKERRYWKKYLSAFDKMIQNTSTKYAPWHVIPADNKWYRNYLISKHVVEALSELKMSFPRTKFNISSIR